MDAGVAENLAPETRRSLAAILVRIEAVLVDSVVLRQHDGVGKSRFGLGTGVLSKVLIPRLLRKYPGYTLRKFGRLKSLSKPAVVLVLNEVR